MRAAFYERQGKAGEVLAVAEVPTPQPTPGEVRVRIYASGLNPSDIKARSGFSAPMSFSKIIPHRDGAGVIDAVGEGVPTSRLGERVWIYEAQYGRPSGTAGEFTTVTSSNAVPLPAGTSFDVGACLGIPALTAHRCLFADGDIKGRRVLIQGGAGAVGMAAILIAKWSGAWVAATITRPEQEEVARSAGADLIIHLRKEDVVDVIKKATGGAGVDRILEVNILANLQIDMQCLSAEGVIVSYATEHAADQLSIPVFKTMVAGCVFRFVYIYTVPAEAKRAAITAINACLADGAYAPRIGLRFPLERIAEAHEAQETAGTIGKILIEMAPA
jgi:NADPH2:quinone reductase